MYTVYRKTYGIDEDICFKEGINYFEYKEDAERYAKFLTHIYADAEREVHPYHNDTFYASEISDEAIRHKQYQNALWQADLV